MAILSICLSVSLVFCFDFFFGQLFVVELDDFLDRAGAVAQVFADLQKFLQDQRSARDGLQNQQLPALDALGDGHFAFARQQRNGAHFAQVHANRIVGLFERSGSEVEIAVFATDGFFLHFDGVGGICRRKRSLGAGKVLVHIDAVALEGREQIVDFFRGVHLGRQDVVHLIVEQVAPLLAHGDELPYLIVFFLKSQRHASSPSRGPSDLRRLIPKHKRPGLYTPAYRFIVFDG